MTKAKKSTNLLTTPNDKPLKVVNNNIEISDDSLTLHFQNCYEKGQSDAQKKDFGSFYQLFYSISGTLIITYLTTKEYNSLGQLNSKIISLFVILLIIFSFCAGTASVLFSKRKLKTKEVTEKRNLAVETEKNNLRITLKDENK